MKINEDFIYILRYWPKYSMLSTVTATMDMPDFIDFTRQSIGLRFPAASSPDSAFLSFPLIPAFSAKKTSNLRQASICPICVRASQQLVPHFMILALSLNPVHEYSELI